METKKIIIFILALLLIFPIISFISAVNTCTIESSETNCNNIAGGKVVMHLSGTTNAHGELKTQTNYAPVLCCNFGGGDIACSANNKIIGLSAPTNAHAERPENTIYDSSNNVCYDSLINCVGISANCDTSQIKVLKLSSPTNAHLESKDGTSYGTNICCAVQITLGGTIAPQCNDGLDNDGDGKCDLSSSTCTDGSTSGDSGCTDANDVSEANVGDGIISGNEECDDGDTQSGDGCSSAGMVEVETGYSCTGQPSVCTQTSPTGKCGDGRIQSPNTDTPAIFEQCDDGPGTLSNPGIPASGDGCSSTCKVEEGYRCTGGTASPSVCTQTTTTPATPKSFWASYTGSSNTEISTLDVSPETTKVRLVLDNPNLGSTTPKFEVFEEDILDDDNIRTGTDAISGTIADGKAIATWTILQSDLDKTSNDYDKFYFKITAGDGNSYQSRYLDLTVIPPSEVDCSAIITCEDYSASLCSGSPTNPSDPCQIVENSVPPEVSCTGGNVNCYCAVSNGQCRGSYQDISSGGTCTITETPKSEVDPEGCKDDGKITSEWTASWNGGGESEANGCVGGSRVIQCPAQIALPFFNTYNFIVALILVALIYAILSLRGKIKKEVRKIIRDVKKISH